MRLDAKLAKPAVLGGFDGCASLLGVSVFLLIKHPTLLFPTAVCGALGATLSMASGELLSDTGTFRECLAPAGVMGAATFAGGLAPAVPFAFGTGPLAVAMLGLICLIIGVIVACMRSGVSRPLALVETLGLLVIVAAAVLAVSLAFPSGSGG